MLPSRLRDRTLELVQERHKSLTYKTISEQTGLKEAWVEAFAQERIANPGVRYVETLYIYLTRQALELA